MPAISSGVSLRARRRVRRADTWMLSAPERMAEKAASVSSDVRCRSPEMRVSMKGLRLADCDILDCFDCFSVLLVVGDAGCGLSVVG